MMDCCRRFYSFFFFFSSRRRHTRFDCDWSQTCALPIYVVARLAMQKLGELTGQSFVVDNKGGANGVIGTELAARATPDGYTLLMNTAGAQTLSPVLYKIGRASCRERV